MKGGAPAWSRAISVAWISPRISNPRTRVRILYRPPPAIQDLAMRSYMVGRSASCSPWSEAPVLGRSWVTKGGSAVRRSSAAECEHAANKSSDNSSTVFDFDLWRYPSSFECLTCLHLPYPLVWNRADRSTAPLKALFCKWVTGKE